MRLFLTLLLVAGVLVMASDLLGREFAESRIERQVDSALLGVQHVEATLHGFPFFIDVAVSGDVEGVSIRLEGIEREGLRVHSLVAQATDIELDRSEFFADRRVRVTAVDQVGTVMTLTAADLSAFLGLHVAVSETAVTVGADGVPVETAELDGFTLVLDAGAVGSFRVDLPGDEFFACDPSLQLAEGEIRLICVADQLPPILVTAIGRVGVEVAG